MAEAVAGPPEERPTATARESLVRDLADRARRGDQDAFLALYRATSLRLLNYLRAMVGENDADDVASETWARIVTDLPAFRAERGTFLGWATAIARHRAIDHLRRRTLSTPQPHHLLPDRRAPDDTPADAAERMSTAEALRLIGGLPPDQAQAVLLRVVIGLDARTAGRILRKRPGAVRTAAHRGLRALALQLDRGLADTPASGAPDVLDVLDAISAPVAIDALATSPGVR
ncbi:RNA polymerase sigma factor [Actinacidiphila rubida]|uniref:RNA polymerase sigma-70 factor, ECF subfamily n=1 Tax=Actinacidiphila rubida TaxID=310780 RepID=A0A1H8E5I3_9ACTN|nr:RNA polymerase sigma factor [Actinacidiphila rubida]SEN14676.1 RNA polymerase sigma-70 factor, ECF subfamily [Actinacidiphila rubida]